MSVLKTWGEKLCQNLPGKATLCLAHHHPADTNGWVLHIHLAWRRQSTSHIEVCIWTIVPKITSHGRDGMNQLFLQPKTLWGLQWWVWDLVEKVSGMEMVQHYWGDDIWEVTCGIQGKCLLYIWLWTAYIISTIYIPLWGYMCSSFLHSNYLHCQILMWSCLLWCVFLA